MSEKIIIRRHYIFKGAVQGVGFRYRATHAANMLRVVGWVRNCWDGSVEMEAQGSAEELNQLIAMIRQGTYIWIDDITMHEIPVVKSDRFFRTRHS